MSSTPDNTLDDPQKVIDELRRERDEALARETATAEVLGVINASPGDLAPVFDAMLDNATRLCEAVHGTLATYDGEFFRFVAVHGEARMVEEEQARGLLPPSFGVTWPRLLCGDSVVHVTDVTDTDLYRTGHQGARWFVDIGGGHTLLTIALRKEDALLGALTVFRQEVRPFSDKQIALLQNFAAQAVIAMENARLITETREALEQQTATAEVLQVINSSPGDLVPVFEAMVHKAIRLCDALSGTLWTHDGDRFIPVAVSGKSRLAEPFRQHDPTGAAPDTPGGRLLGGEQVVHIVDAKEDPAYQTRARFREMVDIENCRTFVAVGLRKDGALLGMISVYRQEVRAFSDRQIALLENFAAQAVIAMENARLLTETREALEQQTATAEVLQVINSSPGDLAPVFDAMLVKATRLCEAAAGTFWVCADDEWSAAAVTGMPEQFVKSAHAYRPTAGSPVGRIVRGEPLVHIPDLAAEEVYQSGDALIRAAVDRDGIRTLLSVPLSKESKLLGVFSVYRRDVRPFTDKHIALVKSFAAQAVIAMENARLITETREALEQQTATAEVLGVINSSPGDLAPVFDAMLEKTLRLCEAAHGNFLTYDGEVFHQAAFRGEPQFAEYRRLPQPSAEHSQLARMVHGGGTLHRIDAREGEAYRDDPGFRQMVDGLGIRTSLTVPLRKGDALLGTVRAYRLEVRPFTDKQIALVENFAAQAVIAMENARLLGELRQRTEEVGELNRDLEARVAEQVEELGRVGRLKRFLAPQLAELIVSQGDEKILESHRREIVVVFCDLRGYTAFTETAEPEEVLDFLRQYHGALGPLVSQFEGTLDQFSGDGIMVFFNDPVPCPDPAERAVKMAMAMREAARELIAAWSRHGCELGFGAGIAQGFATLGQIGFSERSGYTAIGTVCNLAARLCAEAKDGQILISSRIAEAVEAVARLEDLGNLELKGLRRPVAAFNVVQSTSPAEARPNLTVVARDTGA